ncbi:hypothetical protein [Psychrobacillus psychrodurans]|uniref:hypothetical protein n=1 Tax=Psychrobacillus psychrodurans TaxID=126157 RepID=UPI003D078C90
MNIVGSQIYEKVICRLNCGPEKATAFLISNNQAITATHAIKKHYPNNEIVLEFMNLDSFPIKVRAVPVEGLPHSPITILQLVRNIDSEFYCVFYNHPVNKDDNYEIFGYPSTKWATGNWILSTVSRRITDQMAQPYDWDIDLNHNSNIEDFSGLSGSPLFINKRLVGVILTENNAKGKAISLGAISIAKIEDIITAANIKIEESIMYDKYEIYKMEDSIDYSECRFIAMLESANIFDHEDCQQEFFNAEIAKSSIGSKEIGNEIKKFKSLQTNVRSVWKTLHRSYLNEIDGNILLSDVYQRIEDLSETTLKGDDNFSLVVKKGLLHQLSDEGKLGWVRDYERRVRDYLKERGSVDE